MTILENFIVIHIFRFLAIIFPPFDFFLPLLKKMLKLQFSAEEFQS
jgi:hypothetical protein